MSAPAYVYRLISPDDWRRSQAAGAVVWTALDERDGYLHLSTKDQALATANLYFADAPGVLALKIAFAPLREAIRFEPGADRQGASFPHLYADLPVSHVEAALALEKTADGYAFGRKVGA